MIYVRSACFWNCTDTWPCSRFISLALFCLQLFVEFPRIQTLQLVHCISQSTCGLTRSVFPQTVTGDWNLPSCVCWLKKMYQFHCFITAACYEDLRAYWIVNPTLLRSLLVATSTEKYRYSCVWYRGREGRALCVKRDNQAASKISLMTRKLQNI